ncbi:MAG: ATP-NAD kinase [Deltaproteobacteria bacterium]|nr:MAG: ATP-NAD kinase [Deltaproteobacteria bacterium]
MSDSPPLAQPNEAVPTVGVIANPMSGRDVRRVAARAPRQTPEDKRNQIQRAVIGSVAAGARRILLVRDCFRTSQSAIEALRLDASLELLDLALETKPSDTALTVEAMRKEGASALVVLGGDGTNRLVARAWEDAPLVSISTGTNNVFPEMLEATTAGAAAGLVASGAVALDDVARPAKRVSAEYADGTHDLALIDVALLVNDHPGSLMPFDPSHLRHLVLARAEPGAVGMSPIGGLLHPSGYHDDYGVEVRCTGPDQAGSLLLVPVSPGLYRNARVEASRKLELGETVEMVGPGVIAFDGDRLRRLRPGERVRLRVERKGPWVIDVRQTLTAAAERGVFRDRHWHDVIDESSRFDCC